MSPPLDKRKSTYRHSKGLIYGRVYVGRTAYQWSLGTRVEEEGEVIMKPVLAALALVREADGRVRAPGRGGVAAALKARANAGRRLVNAIVAAGGPVTLAEVLGFEPDTSTAAFVGAHGLDVPSTPTQLLHLIREIASSSDAINQYQKGDQNP